MQLATLLTVSLKYLSEAQMHEIPFNKTLINKINVIYDKIIMLCHQLFDLSYPKCQLSV